MYVPRAGIFASNSKSTAADSRRNSSNPRIFVSLYILKTVFQNPLAQIYLMIWGIGISPLAKRGFENVTPRDSTVGWVHRLATCARKHRWHGSHFESFVFSFLQGIWMSVLLFDVLVYRYDKFVLILLSCMLASESQQIAVQMFTLQRASSSCNTTWISIL